MTSEHLLSANLTTREYVLSCKTRKINHAKISAFTVWLKSYKTKSKKKKKHFTAGIHLTHSHTHRQTNKYKYNKQGIQREGRNQDVKKEKKGLLGQILACTFQSFMQVIQSLFKVYLHVSPKNIFDMWKGHSLEVHCTNYSVKNIHQVMKKCI